MENKKGESRTRLQFSGYVLDAHPSSGLSWQEKGGQREYRCRFVKAGRVKSAGDKLSSIEIMPEALLAAVTSGKFEARAVFVDHANFFENPSLKNLAGVTYNTSWNPGENAVEGCIRLYSEASPVASLLDEILADEMNAPDVGLSIVFYPQWAPGVGPTAESQETGQGTRKITGIRYVESVDLVFQPAADGRVLEALSGWSVHARERSQENFGVNSYFHGGSDRMENENVFAEGLSPSTPPEGKGSADLVSAWLQAMSRTAAAAMIAAASLPVASKERLAARSFETPGEVESAIAAERAYLAKLNEDNVIQIGGAAPRGGSIQTGLDALDKVALAAEALLSGSRPAQGVPPLTGIRELYILLSGDYELTGLYQPERVSFANANSSTLAGLTANVLNKLTVNLFHQYPRWWERICTMEDFNTLQAIRWNTLGGVGELPTVAEGAAYTELSWDDSYETASFMKKGGYLGITLETIDKDDTRKVQAAPRALAQAGWLTLSKAISAIFTANSGVGPTLADTGALFNSTAVTSAGGHANLGSTALSITTWAAARLAMRKQVEVNSGERLGALTAPRYLLVPPDLEITALQVLASEKDYTYAVSNAPAAPDNVFAEGANLEARMRFARERVIVVDLWTDTNDWAAVADPKLYPTIGIGFRYGRTPEIFSVASPTAGLMFSNDTFPVKVRFFFAVGPMDFRGLYKANVS